MWYEPESSLAVLLETIIQNYEGDREKYWSDDSSTVRLRQFVDSVATSMVDSSDELVLKRASEFASVDWTTAKELIRDLDLSSEVRAKAEIVLAWRFATKTDEMANRCIELAEIVLETHPSERVLRFLRRLGTAYIVGLFPEAIMLCRGVLENAVDDAIGSRQLQSDGRMRSKLQALEDARILKADVREKAWLVWQRGNTAVHKDPSAVGQALETIRLVLEVLAQMQGPPPSRQAAI